MSLAIINSRANLGMQAPAVTIEVHLSKGLPGLCIVGLPEKAVKESKDRVRCAIMNSGFEFPVKRIVVNLAPADLPKESARFDLPIALGILAANGDIPSDSLHQFEFVGELALTGELKAVKGILPMALMTKENHRALILPKDNVKEASLAADLTLFSAGNLQSVTAHLMGIQSLEKYVAQLCNDTSLQAYPDLIDVLGQAHAKRALMIAAAGGHSILFSGPPGTGKTMLSSRLPGILPEMTESESQETAVIYSISTQGFNAKNWQRRPFRSPHHTASSVALVGGGSPPKPGEISLAHNGVLFLDELPEFNRHVLEALREPLESGTISISRAARQEKFPCRFQLIAAMNPCPCGYYGDASGRCKCTREQIVHYQNKLSGPLLDRIDMHVTVPPIPTSLLIAQDNKENVESSESVRKKILSARQKQYRRSKCINVQLTGEQVRQHCFLEKDNALFLENAMIKLGLSARAYHRILKLSRTIADLDESDFIAQNHIQEALSYRYVSLNN